MSEPEPLGEVAPASHDTSRDALVAASLAETVTHRPSRFANAPVTRSSLPGPGVVNAPADELLPWPQLAHRAALIPRAAQELIDRHGAQWTLPGLPELAGETLGEPDIRIAIIDGPVDTAHVCFDGAHLIRGQTMAATHDSPHMGSAHGTLVTSVLFGQPGSSVRGIASACTGILLPVYRQSKTGALQGCTQRDLARAIAQAQAEGAHVIVISGGELARFGDVDPFLRDAVERCASGNTLIVAATGNDGREWDHVPAALPAVIAVGAMDVHGQPFPFSNWGPGVRDHGIMAPGVQIRGAVPGDRIAHATGTSFATPVVAGVIALLLCLQRQRSGHIDARAVRAAIFDTAIPCDSHTVADCRRMLGGTLNIAGVRKQLDIEPGTASVQPSSSSFEKTMNHTIDPQTAHTSHTATAVTDEASAPAALPAPPSPELSAPHPATPVVAPAAPPVMAPMQTPAAIATPALAPAAAYAVHASAPPMSFAPAANMYPAGGAVAGVQPACPPAQGRHTPGMANAAPSGMAPSAALVQPAQTPLVQPAQKPIMTAPGFPRPDSVLVYVIGQLGYDFGTEARRDYFIQSLPDGITGILDPVKMAEYLGGNPAKNLPDHNADADSLIWTLNIDNNPVYAIRPDDGFAFITYAQLIVFLKEQELQGVERISIAGEIKGSTRLFSGEIVPTISPVLRGMFNWSTEHIVAALGVSEKAGMKDAISKFLNRVYYELRNLGTAPQERSINFAATNAYQAKEVFADALNEDLQLDKIAVERSPICRPESDCWDVKLTFFDPKKIHERARKVYRYTVDVVDLVPVTVGKMSSWDVY